MQYRESIPSDYDYQSTTPKASTYLKNNASINNQQKG